MSRIQIIVGAVALTVAGIYASDVKSGRITTHSQDPIPAPKNEFTMVKELQSDEYVKQGARTFKKLVQKGSLIK